MYDRESGSLTHKASSNPLEILLAPPGTHKEDYGEGQRWGESLPPQPDPQHHYVLSSKLLQTLPPVVSLPHNHKAFS